MGNEEEEKGGDGEDERRESAIASIPSLQPSFKSTRVTQHQLFKLQELHKRRLKIKSKIYKKPKGGTGKPLGKDVNDSDVENSGAKMENLDIPNLQRCNNNSSCSVQQDSVAIHHATKKRQKLHWGLDTKERWERKANM